MRSLRSTPGVRVFWPLLGLLVAATLVTAEKGNTATGSNTNSSQTTNSQTVCPTKNQKLYDDVIRGDDRTNIKWFTAPTTIELHKAAYVFDTERVKCFLTRAKIDPNTKVPLAGGIKGVETPLGAASFHIYDMYDNYKVTKDMVDTVQALLDAGAKPDVVVSPYDTTPLGVMAALAGSGNDVDPMGQWKAAEGLLTMAKALVAKGANIDFPAEGTDNTPLGYLVLGINQATCKDSVYKQFMEFLISKGADVEQALAKEPVFGEDCPALVEYVKNAASSKASG